MKIEKININELKAADYNPRKDLVPEDEEYQHIKNSIKNFGYIEPIVVNERNGIIVGGHQRAKVLKDLGYSEVECIFVNLNEQEEKAANVSLNSATGSWDEEKLKELLQEITEFNMSDFGALEEELQELGQEEEQENYSITYEIVFNNEEEQRDWFNFIKYLKQNFQGETISERLSEYIRGIL